MEADAGFDIADAIKGGLDAAQFETVLALPGMLAEACPPPSGTTTVVPPSLPEDPVQREILEQFGIGPGDIPGVFSLSADGVIKYDADRNGREIEVYAGSPLVVLGRTRAQRDGCPRDCRETSPGDRASDAVAKHPWFQRRPCARSSHSADANRSTSWLGRDCRSENRAPRPPGISADAPEPRAREGGSHQTRKVGCFLERYSCRRSGGRTYSAARNHASPCQGRVAGPSSEGGRHHRGCRADAVCTAFGEPEIRRHESLSANRRSGAQEALRDQSDPQENPCRRGRVRPRNQLARVACSNSAPGRAAGTP